MVHPRILIVEAEEIQVQFSELTTLGKLPGPNHIAHKIASQIPPCTLDTAYPDATLREILDIHNCGPTSACPPSFCGTIPCGLATCAKNSMQVRWIFRSIYDYLRMLYR